MFEYLSPNSASVGCMNDIAKIVAISDRYVHMFGFRTFERLLDKLYVEDDVQFKFFRLRASRASPSAHFCIGIVPQLSIFLLFILQLYNVITN